MYGIFYQSPYSLPAVAPYWYPSPLVRSPYSSGLWSLVSWCLWSLVFSGLWSWVSLVLGVWCLSWSCGSSGSTILLWLIQSLGFAFDAPLGFPDSFGASPSGAPLSRRRRAEAEVPAEDDPDPETVERQRHEEEQEQIAAAAQANEDERAEQRQVLAAQAPAAAGRSAGDRQDRTDAGERPHRKPPS